MKYKKTVADLEKVAVKWWPKELEGKAAEISVIPKLLETQEQFISILKLAGKSPEQVLSLIEASDMPPNLFLKHLVVLSDYGGELIKRLGKEFESICLPNTKTKQRELQFTFNGTQHFYTFQGLPVKGLSNDKLKIDGASIVKASPFTNVIKDLIMLLLYGGASTISSMASLERCDLGGLLAKPSDIDLYVRQKYIYVSRVTTGASANSLGQIAQIYVADYLHNKLDNSYSV